jgi:hypothetical protein
VLPDAFEEAAALAKRLRVRGGPCWRLMRALGLESPKAVERTLGQMLHFVLNPLNIIDLLDLMSTTGYLENIERGPGRHGIANAFFLYLRDKDGHEVDAIIETAPDTFHAVEIKSGETIASDFFSGLDYWRAKLPRQTITPWLIHGGTSYQQREKATVLPWNGLSPLIENIV